MKEASEQLAQFLAVQNTYLSTFQSLGGLGLLLGTVGLAVVQLRSVLERRGELALMRAEGFQPSRLVKMVVFENAVLLVGGLAVGAIAADDCAHSTMVAPCSECAVGHIGCFTGRDRNCRFAGRVVGDAFGVAGPDCGGATRRLAGFCVAGYSRAAIGHRSAAGTASRPTPNSPNGFLIFCSLTRVF